MPDFVDFLPLYVRTEEDIRTDMDADANAGVDPTDPEWVDTRPGQFFHMVTQPFVIEAARIHDQLSTLPAIGFMQYAFGTYLDYHAEALNTERVAAVAATTVLHFTGDPDTDISSGTQVGTEQVDANTPPVIFATTESGSIFAELEDPTGLTGSVDPAGGTISLANLYYVITAYDAAGETLISNEYFAGDMTGTTNAVTLDWPAVDHAVGYRVYRGPAPGGEGQAYDVGNTTTFTDDGTLTWTNRARPTANTTGGAVDLPAQAQGNSVGSVGNVSANALTQMITFNQGVAAVTNVEAVTSGSDVESDPALQTRLEGLQQGQGPGNQADYVEWALDYPNVGQVYVIPNYNGPGGVGVVIMTVDGNPVSDNTVAGLQAQLDPYPAQGAGVAPIDHLVTVMTPELVPIDITAQVAFAVGYSYDGTSSTIAIRQNIINALTDYLDSVAVGATVYADKIKSIIFGVEGVLNVTLTDPAADTPTTSTPPQKATLGTVTLT